MPPKENKKEKTGLMTDFVQVQTGPPAAPGSSAANEDEEEKEEKRPNKRKCPGDPGDEDNLVTPEKTGGEKDEKTPLSSRKELRVQVVFYKKAFEHSEAMLEEKKNEMESLKTEVKELLEKVEKAAVDKTKDEKKIKTLEKELEDIQTEVQDTTGFILELRKDKAAMEENVKIVEKEKNESAENLATAVAQIEELTSKLTSLEQVKADLESEEESARRRRENLKLLREARSKTPSNKDDVDGTDEVDMEESSNPKQETPSNVVLITTPCTGAVGTGKNAGTAIPIHVQALNFNNEEKKAFLENYKISKKVTTKDDTTADTTAGTSERKEGFSTWKSRKWCNKGEDCRFGPENCRYRHTNKGKNRYLQNKNEKISSRRDNLVQQTPAERKGIRTWLERNKGLQGRSCSRSTESSMDPGGKNEDPSSFGGDQGKIEIIKGSRPNVLARTEMINKTSFYL